jgi:hypothetical protein
MIEAHQLRVSGFKLYPRHTSINHVTQLTGYKLKEVIRGALVKNLRTVTFALFAVGIHEHVVPTWSEDLHNHRPQILVVESDLLKLALVTNHNFDLLFFRFSFPVI